MLCNNTSFLRQLTTIVLAAVAMLTAANAQQPIPSPTPLPAGIAAYRLPSIAMVQPATTTAAGVIPGGSVPLDHPVVVFRFTQGEPTDPLDLTSFVVTVTGPEMVNGENRTMLFQLAAGEAWGPIGDPRSAKPIVAGVFQVTARICSSRGACSATTSMVTVLPSTVSATTETTPGIRDRVLRLLRELGRLVVP